MNPTHPEWQEMLDALEAEGAAPAGMLEHLETCDQCSPMARAAREVLAGLAFARGSRPPAALVERAVRAVMQAADPWAALRETFRRGLAVIGATLAADSLVASPAVRGAAPATSPRLMRYDAPHWSISLSVSPASRAAGASGDAAGAVRVRGQILPKSGTSIPRDARAFLVWSGAHAESGVSELGAFDFAGPAAGDLRVAIEIGGERVEAGPF